jgi:hypothetical protein
MRVRSIAAALAIIVACSGCTLQELTLFSFFTHPTRAALSHDQLYALRRCESTDNYAAVSRSGRYRGAYQFSQRTWDDLAGRHYPWLVGQDPSTVTTWWQDSMARALYAERGAAPWPHCGRVL